MNQPVATEEGDVPEGTLALVISRTVGEGIHEDLDIELVAGFANWPKLL
jgi:hypothetical protein